VKLVSSDARLLADAMTYDIVKRRAEFNGRVRAELGNVLDF
jgi:hypothetical protein